MSLDFPASGNALWALYDATGIRPEYLLPPLYYESGGFRNIQNLQGYPYYGINQASVDMLSRYGLTPDEYLALPISEQIRRVVTPEFVGLQNRYGPIRSGLRVYQANFLPGTLPIIKTLDGVLAHEGNLNEWNAGNVYGANAGFDKAHKGTITLDDLKNAVTESLATPAVQSAIKQTYALRPGEMMQDPVYGTDFGPGNLFQLTPQRLLLVGAAGFIGYTLYTGQLQAWWKKTLPAVRSKLRLA